MFWILLQLINNLGIIIMNDLRCAYMQFSVITYLIPGKSPHFHSSGHAIKYIRRSTVSNMVLEKLMHIMQIYMVFIQH